MSALRWLLPACLLTLAGCESYNQPTAGGNANYNGSATATVGSSTTRTAARTATGAAPAPAQFFEEAISGGMLEVRLGHVAERQAASQDVKAFGERMVRDHEKANADLRSIAEKLKLKVPATLSTKHQATVDRLSALNGAEFDRQYMAHMVQDHEHDVATFETVANDATDPQVREVAKRILPTLREHLQLARDTAEQVGAASAKP